MLREGETDGTTRFCFCVLAVLTVGLIVTVTFTEGFSFFTFILPLLFAIIAGFFMINQHISDAYLFMLLSAAAMLGLWTNISTWMLFVIAAILFVLLTILKKPVKEIDVDKDFDTNENHACKRRKKCMKKLLP